MAKSLGLDGENGKTNKKIYIYIYIYIYIKKKWKRRRNKQIKKEEEATIVGVDRQRSNSGIWCIHKFIPEEKPVKGMEIVRYEAAPLANHLPVVLASWVWEGRIKNKRMGMETTIDREKEKLREKDTKIYLESGKQMPLKSERVKI